MNGSKNDMRKVAISRYLFIAVVWCAQIVSAEWSEVINGYQWCYNVNGAAEICAPYNWWIPELPVYSYATGILKIPTSLDGYRVSGIGLGAFKDNGNITSVIIPGSVTTIGEASFSGCKQITDITIHNGVKTIWSSAFMSCYSLKDIKIPSSVESWGTQTFSYCFALTNAVIESPIVGRSAFSYCTNLMTVTLGKLGG